MVTKKQIKNKCKHYWVFKTAYYGKYTRLPTLIAMLMKPDFTINEFYCIKCGKLKRIKEVKHGN